MISRHRASDSSWYNPPISRTLPSPYLPTEPARKDQVPSSQSERRSGECAHKQHVPSLLKRGRRPTRRIKGAGAHVLWRVLLFHQERNKARRSRDRSAYDPRIWVARSYQVMRLLAYHVAGEHRQHTLYRPPFRDQHVETRMRARHFYCC